MIKVSWRHPGQNKGFWNNISSKSKCQFAGKYWTVTFLMPYSCFRAQENYSVPSPCCWYLCLFHREVRLLWSLVASGAASSRPQTPCTYFAVFLCSKNGSMLLQRFAARHHALRCFYVLQSRARDPEASHPWLKLLLCWYRFRFSDSMAIGTALGWGRVGCDGICVLGPATSCFPFTSHSLQVTFSALAHVFTRVPCVKIERTLPGFFMNHGVPWFVMVF